MVWGTRQQITSPLICPFTSGNYLLDRPDNGSIKYNLEHNFAYAEEEEPDWDMMEQDTLNLDDMYQEQ